MKQIPLENLQEQYKTLCFSINEKEEKLKKFPVNQFTLNPEMITLVTDLKILNDERKSLSEQILQSGGTINNE